MNPGKYKFKVRALYTSPPQATFSGFGYIDLTPAKYKFKVVEPE